MITSHVLEECILRLAILQFFPAAHSERLQVSDLIEKIAATDEQVQWLGNRMITLYSKWPGPREMRACFCSRYKPQDGISIFSEVYTEGIPSEVPPPKQLKEGKQQKALPPGRNDPVTEDPEMAATLTKAAKVMSMPRVSRQQQRSQFAKELEAVITGQVDRPTAPHGWPMAYDPSPLAPGEGRVVVRDAAAPGRTPAPKITREEIERAVGANRERKAKGVPEYWKEESHD